LALLSKWIDEVGEEFMSVSIIDDCYCEEQAQEHSASLKPIAKEWFSLVVAKVGFVGLDCRFDSLPSYFSIYD
jgi:hypothetical protein